MAAKDGYQESLVTLTPELLDQAEPIDLNFSMQKQKISEATGTVSYRTK